MSNIALTALGSLGLTSLNILAPGSPDRNIGGLVAQITIAEIGVDDLTITDHPVEQGANITDHSFKNPAVLNLRVAWSNSGLQALIGSAKAALSSTSIGGAIGAFTSPSNADTTYQKLLSLQVTRRPITIVTGKRTYKNMLIKTLSVTTDVDSEQALFANLTCREILIVQTQTTSVTPPGQQANPQNTASPQNVGPVQPTEASGVNRGAFLPSAAQSPSSSIFEVPVQPAPLGPTLPSPSL